MKEIIGAVVAIAFVLGGTAALKGIHDLTRKAALEKASRGLPSLTDMTHSLQRERNGNRK